MTPTSEPARRVAAIMHRKPTTPWSEREIREFRKLFKTGFFREDLALMERYYVAERKKGDKGIHRRDLLTLLNRWPGELDRATAWDERVNAKARKRPPVQLIQRTDATGANIMVESDPAAIAEPRPISESLSKFLTEFEQRKGRKLRGS